MRLAQAAGVENLIMTGVSAIARGNDNRLEGNAAANASTGAAGNGSFDGGAGADAMTGGAGSDTLDLRECGGWTVVAFNKGDGVDVVRLGHKTQLSLSFGGGISHADFSHSRHSADLLPSIGGGDAITLAGWFSGPENQRAAMLPVIDAAAGGRETGSPFCHTVETFDCSAAMALAEKAGRTHPLPVSARSLTDALLTRHPASSRSVALGGDLSYQLAKTAVFSRSDCRLHRK